MNSCSSSRLCEPAELPLGCDSLQSPSAFVFHSQASPSSRRRTPALDHYLRISRISRMPRSSSLSTSVVISAGRATALRVGAVQKFSLIPACGGQLC